MWDVGEGPCGILLSYSIRPQSSALCRQTHISVVSDSSSVGTTHSGGTESVFIDMLQGMQWAILTWDCGLTFTISWVLPGSPNSQVEAIMASVLVLGGGLGRAQVLSESRDSEQLLLIWLFIIHNYLRVQRKQWQPTPVLLPGKSHGWRSLVGCSPWGRKESDMTEAT